MYLRWGIVWCPKLRELKLRDRGLTLDSKRPKAILALGLSVFMFEILKIKKAHLINSNFSRTFKQKYGVLPSKLHEQAMQSQLLTTNNQTWPYRG